MSVQSRRKWLRRLIVAIAALVACALAVAGAMRFWPDAEPIRDIGAGVAVIGDMPKGLEAAELEGESLPFWGEYTTSLSPMVDVSPDGPLEQPVMLRFELDPPVEADQRDRVFVATWDKQADSSDPANWEFLAPEISGDGRYATVTVDHLSWFTDIFLDIGKILGEVGKDVFDSLTGGVFTEVEQPRCENEDEARQDGYAIESDSKDTLYWCFGIEDDQRIVKITNRTGYPLNVEHPGFETISAGTIKAQFEQLARIGSGERTILFSGETAVYVVNIEPGEVAKISTEYSGWAQNLHRLDVAARVLIAMAAKLGVDLPDTEQSLWQWLDTILQVSDCVDVITEADWTKLISTCIPWDMLWELAGVKTVLLWPVVAAGTLTNWLVGEIESTYDFITGNDVYQVAVAREEHSTCISEDEFAQLFIEQYALYDALNSPEVVIDGEVVCDSEWTAARVWTTYPDAFDMGESTPTLMHWEGDHWELTHNGDGQSNAAVNSDCQSISPDSPVYELMECALRLGE